MLDRAALDQPKEAMRKRPLPPTYFLGSVCIMLGLHFLLPVARALPFPWTLSAVIPIVVGVWLNLAADRAFKQHHTTVKPFEASTSLMTEGVFRLTRNPMYLGMVLILLGVALLLGTLSPFVGCAAFAALLHFHFIRVEERMLADTFGPQWRAYRERTRRWI